MDAHKIDRDPPATHTPVDADAPLFVVHNPRSGRHDADADLLDALAACGRRHERIEVGPTQPLDRALERAQRAAAAVRGVLVAAGGDGTLNAAARVALDADLPFGVVARGTFNYFARRHRLPLDAAGALRVIVAGRTRAAQVGLVNGGVFLVNASVGLYPAQLEDREKLKRAVGRTRLVAAVAALVTLLRPAPRLTLRVADADGATETPPRVIETTTLFVGNNPLQLEQVGIDQAYDVTQGRLAVVCVKPVGRLGLLGLAMRGALGRLGDAEPVDDFAVRRLEVEPLRRRRADVHVATDGEARLLRWPLCFEAAPRALRLLVP